MDQRRVILLADDHEDNRDMLSRRLERRGYKVILAEDGSRAVAMALNENPDLILMDVSMPVLNGLDATRQLRAKGWDRPILALTAHAMAQAREECLEAGCDGFETKPVDFVRLIDQIEGRFSPTTECAHVA